MISRDASPAMLSIQLDLNNLTQYMNGTHPISEENFQRASVLLGETWARYRVLMQREGR